MNTSSQVGCGCCPAPNPRRRRVIQLAVAGMVAPVGTAVLSSTTGPAAGDRLVEEDAEGAPVPLKVSDLKPGKPVLAFPFDAAAGKARSETRLNKVVLIRLAEADMTPATRARSAGGVLAYSAICTHQACDVKTWMSKEKALVCFCHSSKFDLLDNGKVINGPATRALPAIPLTLDGELLIINGSFNANPGASA